VYKDVGSLISDFANPDANFVALIELLESIKTDGSIAEMNSISIEGVDGTRVRIN